MPRSPRRYRGGAHGPGELADPLDDAISASQYGQRDSAAMKRAAWVYALRTGWTESERENLSDAESLLGEVFAAYDGHIPEDLQRHYGHELEADDA